MRIKTELKDGWRFVKSAAGVEEAMAAAGECVTLPHTWNAVDGQDGGNDYYRGTCWYVLDMELPQADGPDQLLHCKEQGGEVYVEFPGAASVADVYLNGEKLAHHEGGYSTFRVNLTGKIQEKNTLAVALDNADNDRVYPQKADFTFYGGLYRMPSLIFVPAAHFELEYAGGSGIKVTPDVECDEQKMPTGKGTVTVETWVKGDADTVVVTIREAGNAASGSVGEKPAGVENVRTAGGEEANSTEENDRTAGFVKEAPVINGKAVCTFELDAIHLWNGVKSPWLYTAQAVLCGKEKEEVLDSVETRFGFRSFYTDPEKGFLLNGVSYPLRGVSRHQDRAGAGNALTIDMHREDMELIKEIGANTIRLAHYQHAQEFYDLCDEYGMVVWAEIPYITLHMPNGRENTLSQMRELVIQNYNHPSIVCWGLSNEITAASPVDDDLLENHRLLNDLCHELDQTRFTTMANVFMQETDSPLLEIPDVNSYNLYFGWYLGELEQNDEFFDEYHEKYPDRCIGFSEYGADANPQYHSTTPTHGDYSETYQTVYHEHLLNMIEARPYLWATHVWNMFDFAADGRDEGGRHGENQKGLVTMDRKLKKDAFYLYKAYWNHEDAFVHICGRRYADRAEEVTEVKVYSNQPEVTLSVDGTLLETQQGSRIFRFRVPLAGEHVITARSGECTDEIRVRRVDKPNPDYVMGEIKEVVNWFDEEYKPDCFSIKDKMSDLQASPKAGAILAAMMEQGAGARGDVAESVKDNPNLVRMMGRMTLESLLGHMKDSITEEQIKGLNRVLQQIKKPGYENE